MANVPGKDLPEWLIGGGLNRQRGTFPLDVVVGSRLHGAPDADQARFMAHQVSATAYLLGYDVEVVPRVVSDHAISGDLIVRITCPEPVSVTHG